jgi:predicted ribosome quality control (RQC) complex YloA/Tae2 family protein
MNIGITGVWEKMGNDPENPIVPNQGASGNGVSPSGNDELKEKQMQEFLKNLEEKGIAIEEFWNTIRKMNEQKINDLKQKLQEITDEIQKLNMEKQKIMSEIQKLSGGSVAYRTKSTRTGVAVSGDTKNLRFALDGIEMPASQIAMQLGLSKASAVNWKRVFLSILNGNNGGFSSEVANEIRSRVSIIQ